MLLKKIINKFIRRQSVTIQNSYYNSHQSDKILLQNGKILSKLNSQKKEVKFLSEVEFQVFSQWGDDGIIDYLINYLDIEHKYFIEFGVADYVESNTRFLLKNNNWSGLVMDGSEDNIEKIKNSSYYWKHDITAKKAFITAENINDLIAAENVTKEIGLLHIDIDGNDFWIWKNISVIDPIIVIVEYNSVFGKEKAITVPYQENFYRTEAHYSNLYAGASLGALAQLGAEKGYSLIGSNSAGNNAYFVKNKYLKDLKRLTVNEAYVKSKFREARDRSGQLTFLSDLNRIEYIKGLEVYNTEKQKIEEL